MTITRQSIYARQELERLINPRRVAVVGASETPGSFGQRTLANMADFTGEVFAVNPKYTSLLGRPCVPSIEALPSSPDCIVLCVARQMVPGMITAAGAVGAGGAIIYASGFSETGKPERIAEQNDLVRLADRTGVRLAGPNCVGLANTGSRAGLNFMPDYATMGHRRGPVGIVSQSGALGYTVLQAMGRGIGFTHYLAAGNSADVDVCDHVSYLAEDDDTRAIICLFEGVKDGARFLQAARKAREAGKALIVYKAGNGEASGKAALSHTGTMVGSSAAYQAAFHDAGCIAVDNLESVLERANFFAKSKAPSSGHGVGVLSTSGGASVISADKGEQYGVPLPPLAPATEAALNTVVPDFGSVANPSDLTAEVLKTAETFGFCLDAFVADPGYSALVIPMVFAHSSASGTRAVRLSETAKRTDRPIAVIWMNEWLEGPGSQAFDSDPRVSTFRSADRCFATLRAWFDWHARDAKPKATQGRLASPAAADTARAVIEKARSRGAALNETDSKRVLAAYGVAVPGEALALDPDEAAAVASRIGFPVVAKIVSADIPHKTESGGVRLSLRIGDEVREAAAAILQSTKTYAPSAAIDGISIQQMLPSGVEIVVGIKQDPQFGPLIAVGLGGVAVELLHDTAVRLAPVGPDVALEMVRSLKMFPLLNGYRGAPKVDLDALAGLIGRLSEMAVDLRDIVEEVDVNPVIARADSAVAADALIVLRT
jgi:acetyltransferase